MVAGTMQPRGERHGWRIGVDLGGTWIRVVALDADDRRREVTKPSPGLDGLAALLGQLWRGWGRGRQRALALVVASRGVWTAAERRRHARRLRPFARGVRVISDIEAAYLGALGARPGVLLLAGTGSMTLGRDTRGRWVRAGGLGPLLGDEGSAFWIGREWLRANARGGRFQRARRILASHDPVARIAALAPRVLRRGRAGSRPARRIVADAQAALADLVIGAAGALHLRAPVTVSWAGGLLDDARFRRAVWRAVRRRGLRIEPQPPCENATAAVARMAVELGRAGRSRPAGRPRPRSVSA
jgi:N-acetylglucosamine kinase-like BadF-type ATPase